MSGLGRIMWKEIKELLTPGTLVPIIIMAMIFGILGNAFGGVQDELQKKPELGLVLEDTGYLGGVAKNSFNSTSNIVFNSTNLDEGLAALKDGRSARALIYVPGNFTSNIMNNQSGWIGMYWMKKGAGLTESVQSSLVLASVNVMSKDISTVLIQLSITKNSTLILGPVRSYDTTFLNEKAMSGVTPGQVDAVFSSSGFVVPLIVMLVIIMAGSMVISSMGSEKENKTLETLLTLPVKRTWIVFGKLAGATIVGLIMSFIYMIGLGYYYSSLMTSSSIDLAKYGLTLGLADYVLVGISLFFALLCGLALCMILGIFTKNYKAAQAMTLPVTMLAMIPMFVSIFSDFGSLPGFLQVIIFAIPFSHPMFAINNMLLGQYWVVLAGIVYMAIFAIGAMMIAVTLFKKDILLTGRVSSAEKKKGIMGLFQMLKK